MKKTILMIIGTAIIAGCLPAEETIEDTGMATFVATFETVKGAQALWNEENKVFVVDTRDETHKFELTFGAASEDGEFSGLITPHSSVKYVAYSSETQYDASTEIFSMEIPSHYNSKAAGSLTTDNNAAIGVLQGSQVELKTACGFIKFTLEPNGKTFESDGRTYQLTDMVKVTLSAGDGKMFSGIMTAKWDESSHAPEFLKIEGGTSEISFNTRSFNSHDGNIYYEAGDYYLPVAPQTYEKVTITLEDTEGHKTTLAERSIDVKRAGASNLGSMEWPTVVISADFLCSSAAESQAHDVYSFPSENLMCDRVSTTTGQTVAGKSQKNTIVDFTHQGVSYQLFATNGYGRSTNTSSCLLALMFNTYTASWTYASDTWTVGSPNGYAWVKIPEHEGILSKIQLTVISKEGTPINISSSVDPLTGAGTADIVASRATKAAQSTYETITLNPVNTKPGIAYYICFGNGHSYRIQAWKFYYKVYNK